MTSVEVPAPEKWMVVSVDEFDEKLEDETNQQQPRVEAAQALSPEELEALGKVQRLQRLASTVGNRAFHEVAERGPAGLPAGTLQPELADLVK